MIRIISKVLNIMNMKYLLIFLSVLFWLSCTKSENQNQADQYMNEVISETYNDLYLPDLEPVDITTLLKYRNDKTILKKHPNNPISSVIGDSITVGNIALWTIESIRISELNGDTSKFERYPSLNPIIRDKTTEITNLFELQDRVANIYNNWWGTTDLSVSERILINPLESTNYRWF